ncbi:ABC transporter permease subunit [Janibacter sp. GS2]|uniref:ABC transporter permease subunit n=1 Tax=Janibacter sp. GS2 TaxID=3442646 RepID=UPI003EB834A7
MRRSRGGVGPAAPGDGARLVAPAMVLILAVTGTALGAVLATSLGLMPLVGEPRLSMEGFTAPASQLRAATAESLLTAATATLLAAVIGLTIATAVVHATRGVRVIMGLAAAVMTVSHLVGSAATGLLLSGAGLAQRWSGVPAGSWPELVGGRWPWATVLELAWKESAFVALVVVAAVARQYTDLREVSAVLGAPPREHWRRVFLPLTAPPLALSSIVVFVYSLGTYEVARLLGRAYPDPLPVMAYRLFTDIDVTARPEAAAAAVVATGLALLAALISLPLARRLGAHR